MLTLVLAQISVDVVVLRSVVPMDVVDVTASFVVDAYVVIVVVVVAVIVDDDVLLLAVSGLACCCCCGWSGCSCCCYWCCCCCVRCCGCGCCWSCPWQSLAVNHCENATKIREAILLRENVVNSRRFPTFRLKSTSNPLRITVKTRRKLTVNIHSETLSRVVLLLRLFLFLMLRMVLRRSFRSHIRDFWVKCAVCTLQ